MVPDGPCALTHHTQTQTYETIQSGSKSKRGALEPKWAGQRLTFGSQKQGIGRARHDNHPHPPGMQTVGTTGRWLLSVRSPRNA